MNEPARGIILRTRPLTETSLIVHWLTEDLGRIATVAKGARRPKNQFSGKLDLGYLCDLTFRRSRRSELHSLVEVVVRQTHLHLRTSFPALTQAAYTVELIEKTTESDTPLPEFFHLFTHTLAHPPHPLEVLRFEISLLGLLGLWQPPPTALRSARLIEALAHLPIEQPIPPDALSAPFNEIAGFLANRLRDHLGFLPDSRTAALTPPPPLRTPGLTPPTASP